MNKSRTLPLLVDLLEIDDQRVRVVFCVCHNLGSEERNDMVADNFRSLTGEIGVIYPEMRIEPVDFVGDQLAGNKALKLIALVRMPLR